MIGFVITGGAVDFSLIGILARISKVLAENSIGIFAMYGKGTVWQTDLTTRSG